MTRSNRAYVITIALSLLSIMFWWSHLNQLPSDDGHIELPMLLDDFRNVSSIELNWENQMIRFERDPNGSWFGERGKQVHQVIEIFGRSRLERKIEGMDRKFYGLLSPVLRIRMSRRDQESIADVYFGDLAPDGLSRYVLLNGSVIATIPDYHFRNLLLLFSNRN